MKFMKLGSKPDSFQTDGNDVRFVASDLASDVTVNVGSVKFYLHKFPLLSKSACLQRLVASAGQGSSNEIDISDIPGGPTAFEICAKFCYGMTATLNAYNVVAVHCASEYLEMHENLEKGNLIYKIDVFLNSSIFHSWKDSIIVLKTTKSLMPWTENSKVINRCINSIASKASVDTSKVEWSYTYNKKKLLSKNGLDPNRIGVKKQQVIPKDWWVEDLCDLDINFYKQVIVAIKTKGRISGEVIGEALKAYTYRKLPVIGKDVVIHGSDSMKYRSLIETVVWLLPAQVGSGSCSFLLKLLRAATALDCGEMCKKELVTRIGRQLEEAYVADLLIPSSSDETTMYDVDVVLTIVEQFVMQEYESTPTSSGAADEVQKIRSPSFMSDKSKLAVAKLIDAYLAEIARDANLPLSKFVDLAEMVSGASRPLHDELYCAIDMYLKEHPSLSKTEKKELCSLMDCKKLSMDACAHAVQNERLPLRVVVQVLFFEQVRAATAAGGGTELSTINRSLLTKENGGSNSSSRSAATTNTDDDWDGAPTLDDLKLLKSMRVTGRNESCDINKTGYDKGNKKVKGMLIPKMMFSKLWSSKSRRGENSCSDASESPGSANMEEPNFTIPRHARHSVS